MTGDRSELTARLYLQIRRELRLGVDPDELAARMLLPAGIVWEQIPRHKRIAKALPRVTEEKRTEIRRGWDRGLSGEQVARLVSVSPFTARRYGSRPKQRSTQSELEPPSPAREDDGTDVQDKTEAEFRVLNRQRVQAVRSGRKAGVSLDVMASELSCPVQQISRLCLDSVQPSQQLSERDQSVINRMWTLRIRQMPAKTEKGLGPLVVRWTQRPTASGTNSHDSR